MKYALKGQDIINIYDCLCELEKSNLPTENHSEVLLQLRQYLRLTCTNLIQKVKQGQAPMPIQLSNKQLSILNTVLQLYIQDLQVRYDIQKGGQRRLNDIADKIISYHVTIQKIDYLAKAA